MDIPRLVDPTQVPRSDLELVYVAFGMLFVSDSGLKTSLFLSMASELSIDEEAYMLMAGHANIACQALKDVKERNTDKAGSNVASALVKTLRQRLAAGVGGDE